MFIDMLKITLQYKLNETLKNSAGSLYIVYWTKLLRYTSTDNILYTVRKNIEYLVCTVRKHIVFLVCGT